ncbi:hypothetical protein PLICRDRAFT_314125 [Plicaturopsis crispa FD-325 SS-3]|nr:hypothetical protein PLICRDRAFT_314125 [Plicaturopsis crispa FD-325 SS-3]
MTDLGARTSSLKESSLASLLTAITGTVINQAASCSCSELWHGVFEPLKPSSAFTYSDVCSSLTREAQRQVAHSMPGFVCRVSRNFDPSLGSVTAGL